MFSTLFSVLFANQRRASARRRPKTCPAFRPSLEGLEDRSVPATLQVGASEPYATISSALLAAKPGDTILVQPGVYQEAVNIAKNNITLEGVNQSAIIEPPPVSTEGPLSVKADALVVSTGSNLASNGYSIVEVNGATGVTIKNLTVEGPYTGGFTTLPDSVILGLHAGIYVANGGSATITGNHVTDIRDNTPNTTVDDGFGILVGSNSSVLNTTGTALVTNNTVDGYQTAGIDVAHAGSHATISNNTITGLGATLGNQYLEQAGIIAENGAIAVIADNTVSNNVQTTSPSYAYGIFLDSAGPGVTVIGNTATGNTNGIFAFSVAGGSITSNKISSNTNEGIFLSGTSGFTVTLNTVNDSSLIGIGLVNSNGNSFLLNTADDNGFGFFVTGSTGNQFILNTATGNTYDDAADFTTGSGTAGTGNTWILNHGKTDNHDGELF
jgi:parallel beta-helix repeat protein